MRNKYLKVLIHKANIEKVQCDPYNIDVYCSNEVRSYGKSCERLVKIIQLTHEKIFWCQCYHYQALTIRMNELLKNAEKFMSTSKKKSFHEDSLSSQC